MIDWERVGELRAEIGGEDFAEVVELFLEEADAAVARLAEAQVAPAGAARIESDLHFLKGSALNLGFRDLAALCQDGERAAAAGRPEAVDLRRVAETYARSRAAFLAGLQSRAA
jgi:HPt (histidine-containing phosphotransfer) domain-containing protein